MQLPCSKSPRTFPRRHKLNSNPVTPIVPSYKQSPVAKAASLYNQPPARPPPTENMRITLNIAGDEEDAPDQDLLSLDVAPDTTVGILKESVQAELQLPMSSQHLYHNGLLLSDDSKTMEQLQVTDGDMLALHVRHMGTRELPSEPRAQQTARRHGAGQHPRTEQDAEVIRLQLLGDPRTRQVALRQRPELAAAIDDPERFAQLYRQMIDQGRQEQMMRRRQIVELNADPFDVEAQMRIAEMIREEQVQENLQNAIEHNPEVFGRVHMLYIDAEVNGNKIKAFVDSGAQATIMSASCAEACGIMRLVDRRFSGVAKGVGTANILGRVHSAQIRIGSLFLPCSFTVMEGKDLDLLLGLDMLKRYQACIDLSKDKLIIHGVEVPFLGEADIPKNMEDARLNEPVVEGPAGTTIGARSGAVSGPAGTTVGARSGAVPGPAGTTVGARSGAVPGPAGTTIGARSGAVSGPSPQQVPRSRPVQQNSFNQSTNATPARSQPPASFPPEAIDQLITLGFSREEAINALRACDGDVEFAAGLLFQG